MNDFFHTGHFKVKTFKLGVNGFIKSIKLLLILSIEKLKYLESMSQLEEIRGVTHVEDLFCLNEN